MARADANLIVERFDYSRVGAHWGVARLVARLEESLGIPGDARLLITCGDALAYPARACMTERRLLDRRGRAARGGDSELLWRASFAIELEVIAFPGALFELAASGVALALPAPGLRVITPRRLQIAAPRPGPVRITLGLAGRRVAAFAATVVVTGSSTPAIALADSAPATVPAAPAAAGQAATVAPAVASPGPASTTASPTPAAIVAPTATAPAPTATTPSTTATTPTVAPAATTPAATATTPASTSTVPATTTPTATTPAPSPAPTTAATAPPAVNAAAIDIARQAAGERRRLRLTDPRITLVLSLPGHAAPGRHGGAEGRKGRPGRHHRTRSTPTQGAVLTPIRGGAGGKLTLWPGATRTDTRHDRPPRPIPVLAHPAPTAGSRAPAPPVTTVTPVTPVSGLSSTMPGVPAPASWTGTVAPDPWLTGAVRNLSAELSRADRPPAFLIPVYMAAARRYHVPWAVLAAINSVESDYGRDLNTSSAGAVGWMQFEPSTWERYGLAVDGHSVANPYDPRDAIFSAARYLAAAGAARDLPSAIFSYNHADWYVSEVLDRARAIEAHVHYRRATVRHGIFSVYFATGSRRMPTVSYSGGVLSHFDRLVAAANMVSAAGLPYRWGGGHEQPARFGPFDCSGAVSYVMQQAGYRLPTTVSGDIASWRLPAGPGKVTIFYNAMHTFMRIGNRFFGTSGIARPGSGGAGWFDVDRLPASYLAQFREVHVPRLGVNSFAATRPWAGGTAVRWTTLRRPTILFTREFAAARAFSR
jgi:hypothetical protein